ncbi:MAG: DinB family protein [Candidatus Dormibacteraeota bacterium]|nr:DinB family protein [Candidatus Dormibacteraeota bacterium]
MTGKEVLQMQLTASFNLLDERIQKVTDQEWTARPIPGASLLGFTLWHTSRIIDWTIHCAIQGVPEIADRPEWKGLLASEAAYGAGITGDLADQVARTISKDDLRKYLGTVRTTSLGWLKSVADTDLDRVPDLHAHQQSNPRYLEPQIWAEVSSLAGLPTWQILARPPISHARIHLGEVDLALQTVRARATI